MAIHGDFDHELKIGSTTERFRLVLGENKAPMYSIENFVPEYRNPLTFTQRNWIGGHGQHTIKVPDTYFEGQSIDTTQDGRVFLGPLINSVDSATSKDSYTTGDNTSSAFYGVNWYAQSFTPATTHTITFIKLLIYRVGSPGTVTVSIRAVDGNGQPTGSDLASGTTDGDTLTTATAGEWRQIVFTAGVSLTGGTKYAIVARATSGDGTNNVPWRLDTTGSYAGGNLESSTDSGDTWLANTARDLMFDEYSSTGTALDAAPVDFVWFPAVSKWLCATSGKIYLYDDVGWRPALTTVAGVTDLCVFGSYVFAACGASTAYKYSTDGDTWTTVTTLADLYASYFFVAPNSAGTAEVLWKGVTNELKSNTSGLLGGAEWSSAAYIGDASTNITNIFLANDSLLIGKTDGLWWYDSDGGIHQLRPDLAKNISTDNFKYITEWSAGTYFSEIDGMGEIGARDTYTPMGPLYGLENIGKRGSVVGLAADKDYLYVAKDEGTNTHIYKGREIWRDGVGLRWEWCPWIYLGTYTCATIGTCQHSTTDRRLWFGYTTGTTYGTAYVILSDNPTADSAARFCASGWLRMPYDYGTDAKWDKMWQSAVLEVVGGASGETVQVQYRKDTDTSATSCIAAATTNGVYESNFSAELACNRIQFQLNLASDTNTATPEVSYFQAKGVEKPTTTRIHEAVYAIGDEPSTRAETLRDLLRTARTSTSLIRFADLRYNETTGGTAGTDFVYCVMEPGYPQELEVFHRDKGSTPEMGLRVRMREVSFS